MAFLWHGILFGLIEAQFSVLIWSVFLWLKQSSLIKKKKTIKSPLASGTPLCFKANHDTSGLNILKNKFITLLSLSLLWFWFPLKDNIKKIIFLVPKLVKLLSITSWRKCHCACLLHINFPFTSCVGWFHTGDWIWTVLVWKIIHFYLAAKLLTKILNFFLHDMCCEADLLQFF